MRKQAKYYQVAGLTFGVEFGKGLELEGKLHRLPDIPGERYAAREVYQLENIGGDVQPLSSYERKRLEDRIQQLEKLIHDYQDKLIELMRIAGNAKTG